MTLAFSEEAAREQWLALPDFSQLKKLHHGRRSLILSGVSRRGNEPVILKIPVRTGNALAIERVRREYALLTVLQHPQVIGARDLLDTDAGPVLVMQPAIGLPLRSLLQEPPRGLRWQLAVAESLATALAAVHDCGIVHKDVTPDNVMYDLVAGRVTLLDFGSASRFSRQRGTVTPPASHVRSLAYVAPEQTGQLRHNIDRRTDLYALGVMLYELITGRLPFPQADPLALSHAHVASLPASPKNLQPHLPQLVSDIAMKLLQKAPERRYQSARALARDLAYCRQKLDQDQSLDQAFELDAQASIDAMEIPVAHFGRKAEQEQLDAAWTSTLQGQRTWVLVSGGAGFGKTHLVDEFHSRVREVPARWCLGKCAANGGEPYAPIVAGVTETLRGVLAADDQTLEIYRERIRAALGPELGVVTELLPLLIKIVGHAEVPPRLGPDQTRARAQRAWERLLATLLLPNQLLVLYIDDLQWADEATLGLLYHLYEDAELSRLLVLTTARVEEPETEKLQSLRARMAQTTNIAVQIALQPFTTDEIAAWLKAWLPIDEQGCASLATFLQRRSGGVPLFVRELLWWLHDMRALQFDVAKAAFTYDPTTAERLDVPDHVAELLTRHIGLLPEAEKRVLCCAAVIGSRFDTDSLAELTRPSTVHVESALAHVVDSGFALAESAPVASTSESVAASAPVYFARFSHDRVQQAALALLPDAEVEQLRLKLGRFRYASLDNQATDGVLFEAAGHLNAVSQLMGSEDDRLTLARLNQRAARRATDIGTPRRAREYAEAGLRALPIDSHETQLELALDLRLLLAQAQYVAGEVDAAENNCKLALRLAKTQTQNLRIARLRITLLTSDNRYEEALQQGVEAAALLGERLPARPKVSDMLAELARVKWMLNGKSPRYMFELPTMTAEPRRELVNLLMEMTSAAFLSNEIFAMFLGLRVLRITLREGISEVSPFAVMVYAAMAIGSGNYGQAAEWGRVALELAERYGRGDRDARLQFIFGSAIQHWTGDMRSDIAFLERAHRASLDQGDVNFADFSLGARMITSTCDGENLDAVTALGARYAEFCKRHRGQIHAQTIQGRELLVHQQYAKALTRPMARLGSLTDADFDEDAYSATLREDLDIFFLGVQQLELRALFGKFDEAAALGSRVVRCVRAAALIGDARVPKFFFYFALALGRSSRARQSFSGRRAWARARKRIRELASHCQHNYLAKHLMLEAEHHRLRGDIGVALRTYDMAMDAAVTGQHPLDQALAAELAAEYCGALGLQRGSSEYLRRAIACYAELGATQKVQQLREKTSRDSVLTLTAHAASSKPDESLEVSQLWVRAAMEAVEAIAAERSLPPLLHRLLTLAMMSSGAGRGLLFVADAGRLSLRAEQSDRDGEPNIRAGDQLGLESPAYSEMALMYTARALEPLVLHNAAEAGLLTDCQYVRAHRCQSLACIPLVHGEELRGIVYLENCLVAGAFSPDKLSLLQLISGQAAICLENARMFELEARMTQAARRFVPHEILELLGKPSLIDVQLGDQLQLDMTVLFSDIRSFTSLSEAMRPDESFAFINEHLRRVSPAVRAYRGIIEQYYGDGLMGLFAHGPDDAVQAAISMQRAVAKYNAERKQRHLPEIRIGVGLHTGRVTMGIIGESERLQGAVVADAVNLASRVEGVTKTFAVSIAISEATYRALEDPSRYHHRFIGRVRVKGKQDLVAVYEIFDADSHEQINLKLETRALFQEGLEDYDMQRFANASRKFARVLTQNPWDRTVEVHLERATSRNLASSSFPQPHARSEGGDD